MVLERDRRELEEDLREDARDAAKEEAKLLKLLSNPIGYKDTNDAHMERNGVSGYQPPLASLVSTEVMEEVDALVWLTNLSPESMGATFFYYGHAIANFNRGILRPTTAQSRLRHIQDARNLSDKILQKINNSRQRVLEILNRKIKGTSSSFDEEILGIFTSVFPENADIPQEIQNKKLVLKEQLQSKLERAFSRVEKIVAELSTYKNIPHEQAVRIILEVHKTRGPYRAQNLTEAGAEDHITDCYKMPCVSFHRLYGHSGDYLSEEQKKEILANIEKELAKAPSNII